MNKLKITMFLTSILLTVSSLHAHDPSLHAKKAPEPIDCSDLEETDLESENIIMQAIIKQCEQEKLASTSSTTADLHSDHKVINPD